MAQRLVGQLTKTKSSIKKKVFRIHICFQLTGSKPRWLCVFKLLNSFSPMYLYTGISLQDQVSIGGFLLIHKLLLGDLYRYNN